MRYITYSLNKKLLQLCIKFYKYKDFQDYLTENTLDPNYFMISTGIGDSDFNNLEEILNNINCKFICIDIANGYIENFYTFCKKIRDKYPDKIYISW